MIAILATGLLLAASSLAAEPAPEDERSLEEIRASATAGDARDQTRLGELYYRSDEVPQDYAEALKWFTLAAAQGYAPAQTGLGQMHFSGRGVPRNQAKAYSLYIKAASQGDAQAQYHLGYIYYAGEGAKQDFATAAKWFAKAAAQGMLDAKFELGNIYLSGRGVAQDTARGIELLEEVARKGHPFYKKVLADGYRYGREGYPQDDAKAARWYLAAAEEGFAPAQENLSRLYAAGRGIGRDEVRALMWAIIAAGNNSRYERDKSKLERSLAPAQVQQARKLALACKDQGYRDCGDADAAMQ